LQDPSGPFAAIFLTSVDFLNFFVGSKCPFGAVLFISLFSTGDFSRDSFSQSEKLCFFSSGADKCDPARSARHSEDPPAFCVTPQHVDLSFSFPFSPGGEVGPTDHFFEVPVAALGDLGELLDHSVSSWIFYFAKHLRQAAAARVLLLLQQLCRRARPQPLSPFFVFAVGCVGKCPF